VGCKVTTERGQIHFSGQYEVVDPGVFVFREEDKSATTSGGTEGFSGCGRKANANKKKKRCTQTSAKLKKVF